MIGITSTTLRKYNIKEVAEIAAKGGAEAVEWGSDVHIKSVEDAETAVKICAEKGLKINSYATYYRIGSAEAGNWLEICRIASRMGARSIRTWLGTKGSVDTTESEYTKILEDARFMADVADEYGLIICNECHPNTYNDTTESSLRFINDINRDNFKTYYQSWYCDEKGDMEKLNKTFPFVRDLHISFSEMVKFQGQTHKDDDYINKIAAQIKELGFNGCVLLEFTENGTAEEAINDLKKLKEIFR